MRTFVALLLALLLVSCNGGATLPQTPGLPAGMTPQSFSTAMRPNTLTPVNTSPGAVIGLDNQFQPNDGDTPQGGHGQLIDHRISCQPTMGNTYHVHVYLGVVYKGRQVAIPDTIGMVKPGAENSGFTTTAQCFYFIHTHDASGIIHIESFKSIPMSGVLYHLKNVLDVWGLTRGPDNFGPFNGKVRIFIGNVPLRQTVVSKYSAYTGTLNSIPLQSHEAIWVEIGKPYYHAYQLPRVTFYTEY